MKRLSRSIRSRVQLYGDLTFLRVVSPSVSAAVVLCATLFLAGATSSAQRDAGGNDPWNVSLPNGVSVTLVGLADQWMEPAASRHSPDVGDRPGPWWKPNGSPLEEAPYWAAGLYSTVSSREAALRISEPVGTTVTAETADGSVAIQPRKPRMRQGDVRPGVFTMLVGVDADQLEATLRIGVAAGPWETVERWRHRFGSAEPDHIVTQSDEAVILGWPTQHGDQVRVEVTHAYPGDATRVVAIDETGVVHEPTIYDVIGSAKGLTRHVCWFSSLDRADIRAIEFQRRPYAWAEFKDVSMRLGHETEVNAEAVARSEPRPESSSDLASAETFEHFETRYYEISQADADALFEGFDHGPAISDLSSGKVISRVLFNPLTNQLSVRATPRALDRIESVMHAKFDRVRIF